jgi:uncharacterized membrane protein
MRPPSAHGKRGDAGFRPPGYSVDAHSGCSYALSVAEELSKVNHRRTLLGACVGVILGFAGASAEGPELVSLLFKPLQDSFSCSGSVNLALTQFVRLQLTCAVLGAVLALVAMYLWRRFARRRAEAKQRPAT